MPKLQKNESILTPIKTLQISGNMNYPIQIDNEPQLLRLMQQMAKAVVKELNLEKKSILMLREECLNRSCLLNSGVKMALVVSLHKPM